MAHVFSPAVHGTRDATIRAGMYKQQSESAGLELGEAPHVRRRADARDAVLALDLGRWEDGRPREEKGKKGTKGRRAVTGGR